VIALLLHLDRPRSPQTSIAPSVGGNVRELDTTEPSVAQLLAMRAEIDKQLMARKAELQAQLAQIGGDAY